ncbi:VanZ family protein [Paenibacillus alba]|uniref:VanZ family protein n=1 Tax=Paenibacillus alba TaxID=1197127 RepID=UPI00156751B6|nr:VanZ family protein [Paenibacillus alba]NQX68550.1 VanZ family protein [Paenibacillus alba]
MKAAIRVKDSIVPALYAVYMYAVFKIILFKFSSMDIPFLWHQLLRNLGNLGYIKDRWETANVVPFASISSNIQSLSNHDLINLLGNIAIFMPYGIFLVWMDQKHQISLLGVFMRALGLSLCLECSQLVLSIGSFDVDDLILNVSGGLLGYMIFRKSSRKKDG